jgi:hypothetical protein
MMITALAARWLFTAVFAAAAVGVALPRRGRAAAVAGRVPAVFCVAMCASLTGMVWLAEPASAARVQAAVFGCAALWFGLASLAGPGQGRRALPALLHALMAVAMTWMLIAMPAVTGMTSADTGGGAMAPMSRTAASAPVVAASIMLAVSCAAAALWWLAGAIGLGPGSRVKDPVPAGQAAMSAGMAAMLFAML